MKSTKLLAAIFISALAFNVSSCGKHENNNPSIPGNNELGNTSSPGTTNVSFGGGGSGGGGTTSTQNPLSQTPTTGQFSDAACPRNVGVVPYTRSFVGTGPNHVLTPATMIPVKPDQKLRIQIRAGAAQASNTCGANHDQPCGAAQSYSEIKYFVSLLLADGTEISDEKAVPEQYTIPTTTPAASCTYGKPQGPNKGMCVGDTSRIIYFDEYAPTQATGFQFKVRAFTDAKCKSFCTVSNPGLYTYYYGYYYFNDSLYQKCIQDHCNTGVINTGAVWSFTMSIETENTQCLTQPAL